MPKKTSLFEIRQNPQEVSKHVQAVRTHADEHRDELGFLPAAAYEQAARQKTLFVALDVGVAGGKYVGHILFGDAYPHAKIHQVFVASNARGHGIGRMLVECLVRYTETKQYLSVTAKVAADLPANKFWKALGFETLRTRLGGATRRRKINIRVRQLNTPALFGYREPVSGLPLAEPLPSFTPVFALDLNVFFDVAKRRPRSELGGKVMSAAFNNIVRLSVTEEFTKELRRSSLPNPLDPVLEFALQLPTLPVPVNGVSESIIDGLAVIVFPERAAQGRLTAQDRSDLTHLAIAAHHRIAGFVTAEDALVSAGPAIENQFGIRVVHVRDLAELLKNATVTSSPLEIGFADTDLRISEVDASHIEGIRKLADSLTLPTDLRTLVLAEGVQASNRRSLVVAFGAEVVCVAFWQPQSTLQGALEAVVLADEEQVSSEVALDALLNRLSRSASSHGPTRIQILVPNACLTAQQLALRCGFTRCTGTTSEVSRFQRLSIGTPVSEASWPSIQRDLQSVSDMVFPGNLPRIVGDDVRIPFGNKEGKEFVIDLFDLETTLSPTMFLLPGRSGVLVPIRAAYADDLLGTAVQASLLPRRQAAMIHERTYFSAVRNLGVLRKGIPIVFYESGKSNGRAAAIALARVRSTVVVPKRQIATALIESGVLDVDELSQMTAGEQVAATTVDNVLRLRTPVGLRRLRELGCIDGANLVTSRAISADQLQQIISEGQGTSE